jgi:flagellar biosynthesis protein FlhF
MQIKRFEAKDMTTALRLIKGELGSEAVILSARSLKRRKGIWGSLKAIGVEVTAATDTNYPLTPLNKGAYSSVESNTDRLGQSVSPNKRARIQTSQSRTRSLSGRKPPIASRNTYRPARRNALSDIFNHLLAQGVNRDIASGLIEEIQTDSLENGFLTKNEIIARMADGLKKKGLSCQTFLETKVYPKILVVVGPTGVGKTTTIAKLAARHASDQTQQVALISLDTYRIAAIEELNIYAKAIGIPMEFATSPDTLKNILKKFSRKHVILVDTPGLSPNSNEQIEAVIRYLDTLGSVDIHLLLSAGSKEPDLYNIIKRASRLPIDYLVFTKIDESDTYGNLLNLMNRSRIPLSYLTTGRHVPGCIEAGSIQKILDLMLQHCSLALDESNFRSSKIQQKGHHAGNKDQYYVANKNSDVYHWADCKWTQKIKPENMITFTNIQSAKAKNFMPCRDCQPIPNAKLYAGISTRDKLKTF